jgi:hypothetical protein
VENDQKVRSVAALDEGSTPSGVMLYQSQAQRGPMS